MGQGIEIHPWDVNDEQPLFTDAKFGIARLSKDNYFRLSLFEIKYRKVTPFQHTMQGTGAFRRHFHALF
jgi:hypothetical protein